MIIIVSEINLFGVFLFFQLRITALNPVVLCIERELFEVTQLPVRKLGLKLRSFGFQTSVFFMVTCYLLWAMYTVNL